MKDIHDDNHRRLHFSFSLSIISFIISVEAQIITLLSLKLDCYCDIDCSLHVITDQVICHQVHIKKISVFILVIKQQQWHQSRDRQIDLNSMVTWLFMATYVSSRQEVFKNSSWFYYHLPFRIKLVSTIISDVWLLFTYKNC